MHELITRLAQLAGSTLLVASAGASHKGNHDDAGGEHVAQVAQVWPTVVSTFEQLSEGVDALRAQLAQERSVRYRASDL